MGQHDAEPLRIFNARHEPIGTAPRGEVHRQGHWHETFHCWIVTTDGSLLLQLRSKNKDVWPSRLDATAGGHLAPGEDPKEAALREMEEEIGFRPALDRLVEVGLRIGVDEFVPGIKNYELLHVFFLAVDDVPDVSLQPSEVDALLSARIADLLSLLSEEVDRIPVQTAAGQDTVTFLAPTHFPDTLDDYYYRVAITAERLLRGDAHLRI